MLRKLTPMVVLATFALMMGGVALANTISGELWKVPEAVTYNAIPANVPATTPDVTFDVDSPFTFGASYATVGNWLASGSAYNILENTSGTLNSLMDNYNTGTFLNFEGYVSVANGDVFTVTHDDGLTLTIGGVLVINEPGPTAPVTDSRTYIGPSGNFPFQLVYAECCSGPAVLQISLPLSNTPTIPEPATVLLLGTGLGVLGLATWRKRK